MLRTLSTIERQVVSNDTDARYIMRMMPYRTVDNVIGGVVVTFVDITRITAAETRIGELTLDLRNRVQSLETLLNLLPVGILIVEDDRTNQVRLNRYGAQLLGENGHGGEGTGLRQVETALRVFEANASWARASSHSIGQRIPGRPCRPSRPTSCGRTAGGSAS